MIETHISSLIIQAKPEEALTIQAILKEMKGIELYYFTGGGKFVVTVEADAEYIMADTINEIQSLKGVISTSMVYHHSETPQALEEEITV